MEYLLAGGVDRRPARASRRYPLAATISSVSSRDGGGAKERADTGTARALAVGRQQLQVASAILLVKEVALQSPFDVLGPARSERG
jgi:hypothetical protein